MPKCAHLHIPSRSCERVPICALASNSYPIAVLETVLVKLTQIRNALPVLVSIGVRNELSIRSRVFGLTWSPVSNRKPQEAKRLNLSGVERWGSPGETWDRYRGSRLNAITAQWNLRTHRRNQYGSFQTAVEADPIGSTQTGHQS